MVAVVSVLWALVPIYLRISAFPKVHQAFNLVMTAVGVWALPTWSALGRPAECLCVCGALLVGDLIGYTLEHSKRAAWVKAAELVADESQLHELDALVGRLGAVPNFDVTGWEGGGIIGRGRYGVAMRLHYHAGGGSPPSHRSGARATPAANARPPASRYASSGTCVAKKILTEGLDEDGLRMLANEMTVAATLHHPHLIGFLGYYISDAAQCCLVFEFAAGGTLQHTINRHVRNTQDFSPAVVGRWLRELTQALMYMHARRIVHRDVKASNIFLAGDDGGGFADGHTDFCHERMASCKLGDFGISKVMSSVSSAGHTLVGTPSYMCPEMLKGTGCGPPGDAWALGIVLYQLLTLRVPFQLPAGASVLALFTIISNYDGTLDTAAAAAIEGSPHPSGLCDLAQGHSLLHPQPEQRCTLENVLSRLDGLGM